MHACVYLCVLLLKNNFVFVLSAECKQNRNGDLETSTMSLVCGVVRQEVGGGRLVLKKRWQVGKWFQK